MKKANFTYLLLKEGREIGADRSQPSQLRFLADDPLDELPKRQKQGTPVFRVVLQTIPYWDLT